ncbi:MAG: 2,3-bisphosphoglycerate-independent phosphoglycerate mutase [Patescibacteria group bacterium]
MSAKKSVKNNNNHPVVLVILDGFGISKRKQGNAVLNAHMPVFKDLWKKYPHTELKADGSSVGLPKGEAGNSEAGHQTIGAGRIVESDKVIIDKTIANKSFFQNQAFQKAADHVKKNNSTLHLMGLLTNSQSAHASMNHVFALIKQAQKLKIKKVNLHLFTDGRDTPPYHALKLLVELERQLPKQYRIASVCGRFYAMDRNRNWKRTELAYNAIVLGMGAIAQDATEAIESAYERGESDEYIIPTIIPKNSHSPHIHDNDAVIFWNLRSDRARQLCKPFIQKDFEKRNKKTFKRDKILKNLLFVTLTEFGKQIDGAIAAYPHHEITETIVEALRSKKQIYIAESEKYAHVTYFFNGGFDDPRFGEKRIRIPSYHVNSFADVPQMRAMEIKDEVVKSVKKGYDFICANIANPDMVAHTGSYKATVKACEFTDKVIKGIWREVSKKKGTLIIIADHGNAEEVFAKNGEIDTHHNANPVPCIIARPGIGKKKIRSGSLADIAPTVLKIMHMEVPKVMSGKSLL